MVEPSNAMSATAQETMEFPNGRQLHSLMANDIRLLREAEDKLGVRLVARDGALRITGEVQAVTRARAFFLALDAARQAGVDISGHTFGFALSGVDNGGIEEIPRLRECAIDVSPRRPPILARTLGQLRYLRALSSFDLVFGIGPAGTGKTYLAMAAAVAALKSGTVSRLILTRPAVEAGEALGFLPGSLQDKIFPYLRPLYDALHEMIGPEEIARQMERGVVEIAPLAYMRGRTLANSFIVLDEAQNTTTEQMFMFLTRLGEGSRCAVTGDTTQIDLPQHKSSGLIEARRALAGVQGIAFCELTGDDVVRHPLVKAIIAAYKQHRSPASAKA